ncbi:MAG: LptF/LptG family permease [Prevotellaceae bacterium]|nr:LptF/LptG family permease [Prevotellaceae bacterium]
MKVLHKFIIKSYVGPMVLTFFIVMFIMLMQFLWLYIDEIVGKGLQLSVIAELLFWVSITSIPMALPLSTLFASLMTMGNLGENNELLAIKAAGISLQRILRPLFVLVFIVVVIGGFFASNNLVPYANLKMRSLLYDVKKKRPELTIPEGIFYNGMPDYSIRIGKKEPETNLLRDVLIYDHRSGRGNLSLTIADSGYIKQTPDQQNLIFTLYNGRSYQEQLDKTGRFMPQRGFSRRWFDEQTILVSLGNTDFTRTDESLFSNFAQMQSIVQLDHSYDSLSLIQKEKLNNFESQIIRTGMIFEGSRELDTVGQNHARYRYIVNVDSIFKTLSTLQKIQVSERALLQAEGAKSQIETYAADYEIRRKQIANIQIEWHRKFTLSIACIIFFFIGAPLGAIIRKGGLGMPSIISILFFVIYWVIDISCKKMAQSGAMDSITATWFSSLILAPIAVFLTIKATSDSSLFNPDKYMAFFNKIFGRIKKLIVRVNLDETTPDREIASNIEFDTAISEINKLSNQYNANYRLNKLFIFARKKWLMSEGQQELKDIEQKYNKLIAMLAPIDDDERVREQLRQYPVLDSSKYKLPDLNVLMCIGLTILFPVGIVFYIVTLNKRKKLNYILSEIIDINNTINVILGKR